MLTTTSVWAQIKPEITDGYAHIQCNWALKGWDHIQAFSFVIEDSKLTFIQPQTYRTYEDKVEMIQAGVMMLDSGDFAFGFHGKRHQGKITMLKMSNSFMEAVSIFVPGAFLKNPHLIGTTAKIEALLAKDKNGKDLTGKGRTQSFICFRAG